MIEVTGRVGASAAFDGHFVTLRRKGFSRTVVGKGERRIHVSNIVTVEFKPAGLMTDGFIRFVVPGMTPRQSRLGQRSNDARFDEWAVPFWRKQQSEFERLRDAVETAITARDGGQSSQPDTLDQLRKLSELRDAGILTEAEFAAKKQQ